jgi:hypothetical protein
MTANTPPTAIFPSTPAAAGMYESFYLRAVAPREPLGVWIRYTVHKRPGEPPTGSLWCTVFDGERPAPVMCKQTTEDLRVPPDRWIAIGAHSSFGAEAADGICGQARWSLRFCSDQPQLRHLPYRWMYRSPLPRTKLTSPAPAAVFDGTLELEGRVIELRGWRGMVGHNWGAEHAERWIWLHGIAFAEQPEAWLDVALGRLLVAGRRTPWVANGALCLDGRRRRLGGLLARGLSVKETATGCTLLIPGADRLTLGVVARDPPGTAAGWSYADPDGGSHDVVNCSIAELTVNVSDTAGATQRTLHTAHGGAYELGMRERDHGVALASFSDG